MGMSKFKKRDAHTSARNFETLAVPTPHRLQFTTHCPSHSEVAGRFPSAARLRSRSELDFTILDCMLADSL